MKIIKKIASLLTAFTVLSGVAVFSVPDRRTTPANAETEDTDFDGLENNAITNANFNSEDLIATQKYLLGADYDGKGKVTDINGDGSIDVFDLVALRQSCSKAGNFYQLCSEMVMEYDVENLAQSSGIGKNRIIVKGNRPLDFSEYPEADIISGPNNIYVVQFINKEKASDFMDDMQKRIIGSDSATDSEKDIIYAEFDKYLSIAETDTDDTVSAGSSDTANSWGVSQIEADKYAEYLASTYNSEITVAVVDSGVSPHEFLGDRLLDGYNLFNTKEKPYDDAGHGTRVAGIIVDCTPNLKINILPVRVLNQKGNGNFINIGNGILYSVEHGADVINLSLGGSVNNHSEFVNDAILYAIDNGVTVVVSSGNQNDDTQFYCPENNMESIVVGAVDQNNNRWEDLSTYEGSNFGESVDLVAPGVNIKSCVPDKAEPQPDTGTSMAAPHISAAAAMIKYANPSITPAEVENTLKECCDSIANPENMNMYGSGIPKLSRLIPDNVVPSVTLSKNTLEMCIGYSDTVIASATPAEQEIIWESSDEDIVKIINGKRIKGVGAGTATVTASIEYKGKVYKSECEVTITSPSIDIDKTSMNLVVRNQESLNTTVFPENSVIIYETSDPSVATISNDGIVTATGEGTAEITAKIVYANKKYSKTCTVNVVPDPNKISLNAQNLELYKGVNFQMALKGAPKDSEVTWKSSDENVVTVTNRGMVKFQSKGKAVISATVNVLGVDYTRECYVTADIPSIKVTGINHPIYMGDNSYRITVRTTPMDSGSITYNIKDPNIVKFIEEKEETDNKAKGIEPVSPGKTTISVEFVYGNYVCNAECDIEILSTDDY